MHRDIKPHNVMIDHEARKVLLLLLLLLLLLHAVLPVDVVLRYSLILLVSLVSVYYISKIPGLDGQSPAWAGISLWCGTEP